MHLDSIFPMCMRAPFRTFLRFLDILSLIISNLPCTGTRALAYRMLLPNNNTRDFTYFFFRPRLRSIARGKKKKSKFNYFKRTQESLALVYLEKMKKNGGHETELESTDWRIIRRASIHFGRLFDTIGSRWDDSWGDIAGAKHAARSLATGGTMLSFPECEMHFFQLPFADNRRGNHGLGAGSREDIRALAIR